MPDVVVTVPKTRWIDWIDEGAHPGEPCPAGEYFYFTVGHTRPWIEPGERVYVISHGKLRGFAPLVKLEARPEGWALIREGGAVAVTIPTPIPGFRGWRYRWWPRKDEIAFPDWWRA